ncbi:MAG: helix-hairpin-helix domain-containing protein [Actinomycetota bacterium]
MASRRTAAQAEKAAITRRRLELLSAELAALRSSLPDPGEGEVDGAEGGTGGDGSADRGDILHLPADSEARGVGPGVGHEGGSRPGPGRDSRAPSTPAPATTGGSVLDAAGPAVPGRHARRPVGLLSRLGGWTHDRLPPTLQGRVRLSAAHLSVVALLVAAAFAVTAWWVVRSDEQGELVASGWSQPGQTEPVEPVESAPQLVTPVAEAAASPAAVATGTVVVDVAGRVRRPGIVTLAAGARVVDAIEAAGGARPGVDLTPLNLARLLTDGEQIVVGVPPPGGVAAPAASASAPTATGALVNLNSAGQAELEELPGVGPVTAEAILQWRSEHGPFTAVDELLEVSGIGEATLAELAPHVTL